MRKYEYVLISYMHKTTGRIAYLFCMYALIAAFYFSTDNNWLCAAIILVMFLLTFQAYLFKFVIIVNKNMVIQSVFESDVEADLKSIQRAEHFGFMSISKVTLNNGKFYYFLSSPVSVQALNEPDTL